VSYVLWSWDSARIVTIVARLFTGWLWNQNLNPSKGKRSFSSPVCQSWYLVGIGALSWGVKQQGR
jgi:hypothetical protein